MKRIVLTFGLISGVISSVLMLSFMPFIDRIGFDKGLYLGYTSIVLSFLLVFFGIRSYRETVGDGQITFGRAFSVGILITLISCMCYVIMWMIVYFNFMPDFFEKYTNYMIEQARASGAPPAEVAKQVEEMKYMHSLYNQPLYNAAFTFLEPFPVGLIMTFISALILRRRRRAPDQPELVGTANLRNAQSQ